MRGNPTERVSRKFKEDMKKIMQIRVEKKLMEINEARMPEITELLTRTSGYNIALEELKTRPKQRR